MAASATVDLYRVAKKDRCKRTSPEHSGTVYPCPPRYTVVWHALVLGGPYRNVHDDVTGDAVILTIIAVPEPAVWAIMMLGPGGMGAAICLSRPRVVFEIRRA
jgi:hypothetical protein